MGITREQYEFLIEGLAQSRIGKNPKGFSHLQAWDVRRHLIRVFGFGGFDIETKALDLVAQIEVPPNQPTGKPRWTVIYRAEVRLVVKDATGREIAHFEDAAAGDSQNQPGLGDAHENALKTALSQALKRCAVNMGDQFGLSLYNGGRPNPVVNRSLVVPDGSADPSELVRVATQDEPVEPDPEEAHIGGATNAPEPVEETWDQATPTQPEPPRSSPSVRAVELFEMITTAEQDGELTAAWELVKAAVAEGEITGNEGNQLKAHLGKRKTELAVPAPLRAPSSADLKAAEAAAAPVPDMPMDGRRRSRLFALMAELGYTERDKQVEFLTRVVGRTVESRGALSAAECETAIGVLEGHKRQGAGKSNGHPVGAAA